MFFTAHVTTVSNEYNEVYDICKAIVFEDFGSDKVIADLEYTMQTDSVVVIFNDVSDTDRDLINRELNKQTMKTLMTTVLIEELNEKDNCISNSVLKCNSVNRDITFTYFFGSDIDE